MGFTSQTEADTLSNVQFTLKDWSDGDGVLIGRAEGETARAALEAEIRKHRSENEPVAIDFAGIRAMSVPFADGFFVPLLSGWLAGYYAEHPVLVIGTTEDVAETLAAVLRLRNLAIVSIKGADDVALLGGEPALQETIRAAAKLRRFSATDIATALGLTTQAANNRLKMLVQMGALVRVPLVRPGGGREFEYRVPEAAAPELAAS